MNKSEQLITRTLSACFWLCQDLKESQCPCVRPASGPGLSRALNLQLSYRSLSAYFLGQT